MGTSLEDLMLLMSGLGPDAEESRCGGILEESKTKKSGVEQLPLRCWWNLQEARYAKNRN